MVSMNRRDFLRVGGTGVALGALSPLGRCPFLTRSVEAAMLGTNPKKMLLIFLRGGCDGVNTLIPHGDPEYNDTVDSRPTLFVPPGSAIDLNGFASLHPSLAKLHDVFVTGDVACIHRVAYAGQSFSHFSSMQFWENGKPGDVGLEEGWVTRTIVSDPGLDDHPLAGVSVSPQLQVLFRGDRVLPHIPNLSTYTLGNSSADLKLVGALPGMSDDGSGLLGVYSRPADGTSYDPVVRDTGLALAASLDGLQGVDPGAYMPVNGASYPSSSAPGDFPNNGTAWNFFRQVKDSVQLLKETDARICGVELGSFDTHSNQGTLEGAHPGRLHMLAHAMKSVWQDTTPSGLWNDLLVVTLSEFGRTSQENGSEGTDHGEASCMFVAGGSVNGGVFNCDPTTWGPGDMFSTPNERYVAQLTDFRAVLGEILIEHFGAGASMNDIIPGWDGLTDPTFDPLNFLV